MIDLEDHDEIDRERLVEWYRSPLAFTRDVFEKDPHDYQEDFLEAGRLRGFVAGRQVGKSLALAWLALWKFTTRPNQTILMFSMTQRQAVELFHHGLKPEMEASIFDKDTEWGIVGETKKSIEGANGSRIEALPAANRSDNNTLRGYTADMVIVDEAAFIEDDFFREVIAPMLMTTQGEWVLSSTPYGKDGFFYDKFNDKDDRWDFEQVSSYDNPSTTEEYVDNEIAAGMDDIQYKQEVLGEFEEAESAFYPASQIRKAMKAEPPAFNGRSCYLGVDVARAGRDQTVFCSIDGQGNVFDLQSYQSKPLTHAVGKIRHLNDKHAYQKIVVDETGVGGGVFDELKEDLRNIRGFTFSINSRQSACQQLKKELEGEGDSDGKLQPNIAFPGDDDGQALAKELKNMDYHMTSGGNMKIHPPSGGHDDYHDALVLAVNAWRKGGPKRTMTRSYHFGEDGSSSDDGRQAHGFGG